MRMLIGMILQSQGWKIEVASMGWSSCGACARAYPA
jgi:hypothetical protein